MHEFDKIFLDELYEIKNDRKIYDGPLYAERSWEMNHLFRLLQHKTKNFFPMNGIPPSTVTALNLLQGAIILAENQLILCAETLIKDVSDEIIRRKNADRSE